MADKPPLLAPGVELEPARADPEGLMARAQDIPALLAWLRAKAPNAGGPPAF
jgi:hypothetical protein